MRMPNGYGSVVKLSGKRGADHICIERLVGHSSNGITDKVYTHKDIHELRKAVELVEYKDITVTKCDMA